ncbi:hypothetical protein [Haliangium sp.]|uniref:hypothetical protein n=1 Tax=Haliangium sp. TaxID=2663208 RepID=UPI003D0993DA
MSASAVPVLGFQAGALALAVAADDVIAVAPARAGVVHIADALATLADALATLAEPRVSWPRSEPAPAAVAEPDRRTIHLRDSGDAVPAEVVFLADPPVEVLMCGVQHIVPMAPGIALERWRPVMGFAHLGERLRVLLDIPSLVRVLRRVRVREDS